MKDEEVIRLRKTFFKITFFLILFMVPFTIALVTKFGYKTTNIEKNIKSEITKKAQKDGYKYVFAKSVVLHGGKDITNEIISNIK